MKQQKLFLDFVNSFMQSYMTIELAETICNFGKYNNYPVHFEYEGGMWTCVEGV